MKKYLILALALIVLASSASAYSTIVTLTFERIVVSGDECASIISNATITVGYACPASGLLSFNGTIKSGTCALPGAALTGATGSVDKPSTISNYSGDHTFTIAATGLNAGSSYNIQLVIPNSTLHCCGSVAEQGWQQSWINVTGSPTLCWNFTA